MKVISSKKMRRGFVLLGMLTLTLGCATEETESEFNNDRRLIEEETGGILRLKSRGKLTKIVDLDSTEVVKVNKDQLILFVSIVYYVYILVMCFVTTCKWLCGPVGLYS